MKHLVISVFSVMFVLMVTTASAQPYNQLPTQTVCVGTNQPYFVTASTVPGATYTWSISPAGVGTILSGQGTASISVDWLTAGGPYTLSVYTSANGCDGPPQSVSVTVTSDPAATISYGGGSFSACQAPVNVSFTGSTGGTYSATPAGLTINPTTGTITPATSTPGLYTVHYIISSTNYCGSLDVTTTVTITSAPSATIAYAGNPFCSSVTTPVSVTLTGTSGGTYTASPAGLTINATTGAINPSTSTPGNYTVTYTIAASGSCSAITTTTSVTITAAPNTTPIWHN